MPRNITFLSIILLKLFCCLNIAAEEKSNWKRGVIRINTVISAGKESIAEVAEKARKNQLDFLVFTDQFVVKVEYGVPLLRNVIKISKSRPGVMAFGIENYLTQIREADKKYSDIALIPGVDVAPHYYWDGLPFAGSFSCRQYSEQLTVFGPSSNDFYANLPVIHNDITEISFGSMLKLLPLLLVLAGFIVIINRKNGGYKDAQGNTYPVKVKSKIFTGIIFIIFGTLWTINNRPFSRTFHFDQYKSYGLSPYQQLIDYVGSNSGKEPCGIFWSAPEATMKDVISGVHLITAPYFYDVSATYGHNGFAGIYGDVSTAHEAGNEWDRMLMQYCRGERKKPPVVIGELDYHGKKRRIDMIQTVVNVDELDSSRIVDAVIRGKSYAYEKAVVKQINIDRLQLSEGKKNAGLGETLHFSELKDVNLHLRGSISGSGGVTNITVSVILNGKKMCIQKQYGNRFNFEIPLKKELMESNRKNYIRLIIKTNNAGRILTNPIYIENISLEKLTKS